MRAFELAGAPSRRMILGYGAASLAAPAVAQPTPQPPAEPIQTDIDAAHHLTVDVMINGRGPFRFVVDTGADRSVICTDVAVALGLIRASYVTVQGVVRAVDSQTVAVDELRFGSFRRTNLMLPLLPRALLRADGYLGLDAIDNSRVTFDFRHHTLTIGAPRHATLMSFLPPSTALVPVRGSMGHLRAVNCRVDGVSTAAFIDTGAEVAVGNSKLYRALVEANPSYNLIGVVPLTGVTGGQIQGSLTNVHRIRINAVEFSDCAIVIADMQIFDIWGLSDTPALLVGMNFLSQFSQVSIDYGRKELLFELASLVIARRG